MITLIQAIKYEWNFGVNNCIAFILYHGDTGAQSLIGKCLSCGREHGENMQTLHKKAPTQESRSFCCEATVLITATLNIAHVAYLWHAAKACFHPHVLRYRHFVFVPCVSSILQGQGKTLRGLMCSQRETVHVSWLTDTNDGTAFIF